MNDRTVPAEISRTQAQVPAQSLSRIRNLLGLILFCAQISSPDPFLPSLLVKLNLLPLFCIYYDTNNIVEYFIML